MRTYVKIYTIIRRIIIGDLWISLWSTTLCVRYCTYSMVPHASITVLDLRTYQVQYCIEIIQTLIRTYFYWSYDTLVMFWNCLTVHNTYVRTINRLKTWWVTVGTVRYQVQYCTAPFLSPILGNGHNPECHPAKSIHWYYVVYVRT